MKHKFNSWLLLAVVIFSLHSCMHDDFGDKEEENHISTFRVFQKTGGKETDYAQGFTTLFKKYKKLNPEFSKSLNSRLAEEKPVVYLYIASQVFTLKDGSKAVVYPILKDEVVVGLWRES